MAYPYMTLKPPQHFFISPSPVNMTAMTREHTWFLPTPSSLKQIFLLDYLIALFQTPPPPLDRTDFPPHPCHTDKHLLMHGPSPRA